MTKSRSNATAPAAKGELVIGTGTDASGILSVGANDTVLTADSSTATGLKWAAPSGASFKGCRIWNDGAISVSNNTVTVLTFNSQFFDTNNFHSTSSNTGRITIPAGLGGYYLFDAAAYWAVNATGVRYLWLTKNGNRFGTFSNPVATSAAGNAPEHNVQIIINASANDYFELNVEQNSGGALNIGSSVFPHYLYFACAYLGA